MFKQESFVVIACKFFNDFILNCDCWKRRDHMKTEIMSKFGEYALTEEEKEENYNLLEGISISNIFKYISKKVGISLRLEILERFMKNEKSIFSNRRSTYREESISSFSNFEFVPDDFETFVTSVKGLTLFSMATAESIRDQAINKKSIIDEKLSLLFRSADLMDEGKNFYFFSFIFIFVFLFFYFF